MARAIVRKMQSCCKSLVLDLAFVLQAEAEDELPERVLGCLRLDHVNLDEAPLMDHD